MAEKTPEKGGEEKVKQIERQARPIKDHHFF